MKLAKLCVLASYLIFAGSRPASALSLYQEMNIHTMLEATTAAFDTLGDYSVLNPVGETNGSRLVGSLPFSWTGNYSNDSWNYIGSGEFAGQTLHLNYSGARTGVDGNDITINFTGSGNIGSQPLLFNGSTKWLYDSSLKDYVYMNFEQLAKIGPNSLWGWATGIEIFVGVGAGVVSGLVAGGAITIGTGGTGAPAGLLAGLKTGFLVGGAATAGSLGSSVALKTLLQEDNPPQKPPAQTPPASSDKCIINIQINIICNPPNTGTIIQDNGKLDSDSQSNLYRSSGTFTPTSQDTGAFIGETRDVPGPLPILGAGIAYRFSRKLRSRINLRQPLKLVGTK
jgi:hypothetical protein